MPDTPPFDNVEQAMEHVIQQTKNLRQTIIDSPSDESTEWFRRLLCGLLNSTLRDYQSVKVGISKSIPLAAWGARNLLELSVITEYVLKSEANALDFKTEFIIDAKEFNEAISSMTKAVHEEHLTAINDLAAGQEPGRIKDWLDETLKGATERGTDTSIADGEADGFRFLMQEMGVKPNEKPKSGGEFARLLGPQSQTAYKPMSKICSKLVHPTALSIATTTIEGSIDAIVPLLENSATIYLLAISSKIEDHFKIRGVRPPDPA